VSTRIRHPAGGRVPAWLARGRRRRAADQRAGNAVSTSIRSGGLWRSRWLRRRA